MAITVGLLEKMLISEVENLHIRIDEFQDCMVAVEAKLDSVERRLDLLQFSVEELRVEMRGRYATKDDLRHFATKEDFRNFATKDDLRHCATKNDLRNFATKDDLRNFATKNDLVHFKNEIIATMKGLLGSVA